MLGVYDEKLILSWTPAQYLTRTKGARLRLIDENERAINAAILSGSVARSDKKIKAKSIYDAEKMRKEVMEIGKPKKQKYAGNYTSALKAINSFNFGSVFQPKVENKKGE